MFGAIPLCQDVGASADRGCCHRVRALFDQRRADDSQSVVRQVSGEGSEGGSGDDFECVIINHVDFRFFPTNNQQTTESGGVIHVQHPFQVSFNSFGVEWRAIREADAFFQGDDVGCIIAAVDAFRQEWF